MVREIADFKLNSNSLMPGMGMGGVAGFTEEERVASVQWFITALEAGYRHFDTAWLYGTEKYIGEAIRLSGIPRENIWITTKLPWHHPGLKSIEESLDESLRSLDTDYIDLYLIHWPQVIDWPDEPQGYLGEIKSRDSPTFVETWPEMEALYKKGKARNIGVSNFSVKTLEELLKNATVIPAVNQVEIHPYLVQEELKQYCDQKGIVMTAYAPTGNNDVLSDPLIVQLAAKNHASPVQVVLAWNLARGISVVVKSANKQRQIENINLPELEPSDVLLINSLDRNVRIANKPNAQGIVHGWTMKQLGW